MLHRPHGLRRPTGELLSQDATLATSKLSKIKLASRTLAPVTFYRSALRNFGRRMDRGWKGRDLPSWNSGRLTSLWPLCNDTATHKAEALWGKRKIYRLGKGLSNGVRIRF
jgi:hypothetical protein